MYISVQCPDELDLAANRLVRAAKIPIIGLLKVELSSDSTIMGFSLARCLAQAKVNKG
jgi:hypothetical protein